jgi:hypothetical protein
MTQDDGQWCCDPHVAEFYDQWETEVDDVELIKSLIGGRGPRRILEPFAGTGRIFIPLALDGHAIVTMDRATPLAQPPHDKGDVPRWEGSILGVGAPEASSFEG